MSLHAPFLVKQYLSSDVESGSYSRIFWYYPLEAGSALKGGIGLFFEVVSGELNDDQVYEQVVKRFWESFKDNFYVEGFEQALKKSVKMFIQMLRNFGVEEGLDVNISLLNVVESGKGYMLKLISFGDSDIFVVREGKFADMGKMVPKNESLYDLKFLEVELDKGDVLLLGNKSLLRNAFENDLLEMQAVDKLLDSLENFKENLFGSNKLFLIAATDLPAEKIEKRNVALQQTKKVLSGVGAVLKKTGLKLSVALSGLMGAIKERQLKQPLQSVIKPNDTPPIWSNKMNEEDAAVIDIEPNEEPETETEVVAEVPVENLEDEAPAIVRQVVPPPIEEEPEIVLDSSDVSDEKADDIQHIVDPVDVLPGKDVSVEDFVVAEEITPSMKVEKSEYKEIVTDALENLEEEPVAATPRRYVESPSLPVKGKDYVNELRARHSPLGKIKRHPVTKAFFAGVSAILGGLWQKFLKIIGKEHLAKEQKLFLTRPSALGNSAKRVPPGFYIIFFLLLIGIFLWVKSTLAQKKLEKEVLATYQAQVALFSTFYERNIEIIDTEDTERQLELCSPEAQKVYSKEKDLLTKVKSEESITLINELTSQVRSKEAACKSKYDKIYGIVRVKDAELLTDFKVSLGNDSNISAISLRGSSIVVADKGRKAVYQINVETKGVTKLEDPLGLVVEPIIVGTGEGTLFVCDKVNGVLYYSKNAVGNNEGFNRVVGAEPTSIGECAYVDGYAQNAYIVPTTANVVYKITAKKAGGFEVPTRYMSDLQGVKSISIDGHIYVVSSVGGKGSVSRYLGGKLDTFSIPQSAELGELGASYTNPSGERNLYVYDKTKNAVLSIEKPNSKHPGRGIVEKTYLFENQDKFNDVKSFVIDLNVRNQEVNMYVLSGTTIWKVKL